MNDEFDVVTFGVLMYSLGYLIGKSKGECQCDDTNGASDVDLDQYDWWNSDVLGRKEHCPNCAYFISKSIKTPVGGDVALHLTCQKCPWSADYECDEAINILQGLSNATQPSIKHI